MGRGLAGVYLVNRIRITLVLYRRRAQIKSGSSRSTRGVSPARETGLMAKGEKSIHVPEQIRHNVDLPFLDSSSSDPHSLRRKSTSTVVSTSSG